MASLRDRVAGGMPRPPRPITIRAIVLGGLLIALIGAVVLTLLLAFYGSGSPQDQARLDAIKTAGTIVVGTGGAVALLLGARRQRSTELTLEHEQRVAALAEYDANERRITELYTKAAEQLGSDKAPVRLAGLYALDRLGEATESQRGTIVNVVCAYLRMPFQQPADDDDLTRQELQVRLTAKRILHRHRRFNAPDEYWQVTIDLDGANLAGAHLPEIDLELASLFRANLTDAYLLGANLTGADLTSADLTGATLAGAELVRATLDGADLAGANLGSASLAGALLTGATWSAATVWPDEVTPLVTAASTESADDRMLIGELRLRAPADDR